VLCVRTISNYKNYIVNRSIISLFEILDFAEIAIQILNRNCPQSITDGIVRVDIMEMQNKKMFVNEFESLEADYHSDGLNEAKVNSFLVDYWTQKLDNYLINLL
jgi:hypothetical protein